MHHMSTTPPNGQTDDDDDPLPPPHPRRRRGRRQKVLPRPGNIIGGAKCHPTMLPGHGSTFLQLSRRRNARLSPPYAATTFDSCQGHRKCQNTRVVKNHPRVSYPFRLPSNSAPSRTNKGDPQPPFTTGIRRKNTKMPPASSESTLALPGDVGDDQAQLCARFRRRPPPGSP